MREPDDLDLLPHSTDPTPMSASALVQCQFGAWYPRYRGLAPESVVIPLPDDFAAYLEEGGVFVDDESDALPRAAAPVPRREGEIIDEDDYRPGDYSGSVSDSASDAGDASDAGGAGGAGGDANRAWGARWPELRARIEEAVASLGGAVAPKLNWSSPTDALWVAPGNSLRCCSADQVVLLLKSSPRAAFDLELSRKLRANAGLPEAAPALVLRRWEDVAPEREFRCFIHGHRPVGICQRDPTQYFPQLAADAERGRVRDAVCAFHEAHFGRGFTRGSYALDVVVQPSGEVTLIDVNPIADTTQPLLFDWQQLPYSRPPGAGGSSGGAGGGSSEGSGAAASGGGGAGDGAGGGASGGVPSRSASAVISEGGALDSEAAGDAGDAAGDAAAGAAGGAGPDAWARVPLLLVESEALVRPGMRAACGMPLDMLDVQEGLDEVVRMMQQQGQQQQHARGGGAPGGGERR